MCAEALITSLIFTALSSTLQPRKKHTDAYRTGSSRSMGANEAVLWSKWQALATHRLSRSSISASCYILCTRDFQGIMAGIRSSRGTLFADTPLPDIRLVQIYNMNI